MSDVLGRETELAALGAFLDRLRSGPGALVLAGVAGAGKTTLPRAGAALAAELVARGLTNRQVAADLFVTVRAVESTLTKVYAKLGIRSRTQLAAWLNQSG